MSGDGDRPSAGSAIVAGDVVPAGSIALASDTRNRETQPSICQADPVEVIARGRPRATLRIGADGERPVSAPVGERLRGSLCQVGTGDRRRGRASWRSALGTDLTATTVYQADEKKKTMAESFRNISSSNGPLWDLVNDLSEHSLTSGIPRIYNLTILKINSTVNTPIDMFYSL